MDWAINFLKDLLKTIPEFTGRIEINFFKGGVSNINRLESIKPQPEREG